MKTCKVHHRILHDQCDGLDLTGLVFEYDLSGARYNHEGKLRWRTFRVFLTKLAQWIH